MRRQSLPQIGDVARAIAGYSPGLDVFVGKFRPSVFWRGFVIGAGEDGDQASGDVFGGKDAANESHAEDESQFMRAKHPVFADSFEQGIDQEDEEKWQPQ